LGSGKLKTRWRYLAIKRPIGFPFHLHRIDFHVGEEPLFLDVELQSRPIARVMIVARLKPSKEFVGAAGGKNLVIERADNPGFQDRQVGGARYTWRPAKTADAKSAAAETATRAAPCQWRQKLGLRVLAVLENGVNRQLLEEIARHLV